MPDQREWTVAAFPGWEAGVEGGAQSVIISSLKVTLSHMGDILWLTLWLKAFITIFNKSFQDNGYFL